MIKVHYVGYGTRQTRFSEAVKRLSIGQDDDKERGYFYLPNEIMESLEIHGVTDVSYLMFENLNDYKTLRLNITNKDGNPAPITIKKGQDRYPQENGNALRLYFDDAPPAQQKEKTKNQKLTRQINLSKAIDAAITSFGRKPSFDELWQYFQDDKDETDFIKDFTDTHIIWVDTKGCFHNTQKNTIRNRLAKKQQK
jgi:hypothetical protein